MDKLKKEMILELIQSLRDGLNELEKLLTEGKTERQTYTIPEVASLTGLHPTTVWKYLKERKIKGVKVGSKYLIPADEVERLIGKI